MTRMRLKRSSITTTQHQHLLLTTKKESLASRVTLLTWAMSMRTMRMKTTRVTTVTKMVKMVTTLRSMRLLIQVRNYILTANQVMLQLLSTLVLIHTTKESQEASSKSHKD